jgi:hypothetical protein
MQTVANKNVASRRGGFLALFFGIDDRALLISGIIS